MAYVENPVSTDQDGVKVRPELMEREKLYHVIFAEKIFLIFKDSQGILNCYEIEEKELVKKAKTLSGGDIDRLLEEYVKTNLQVTDRA